MSLAGGMEVSWSPGLCIAVLPLCPVLPSERMDDLPSQCGPAEMGTLALKAPSAFSCLPMTLHPTVFPALVSSPDPPVPISSDDLTSLFLPSQVIL